jgi:hypothetical protein
MRKRAGPIALVLIPPYLINMFCLAGLFIQEDNSSERLAQTAIGFLTLMGYTYVIESLIPTVGWLLWIHWYVLMSMTYGILAFSHCVFTHFAMTEINRQEEKMKAMGLDYAGEEGKEDTKAKAWCLSMERIRILDDVVKYGYPALYNLSVIAMVLWVYLEAEKDK